MLPTLCLTITWVLFGAGEAGSDLLDLARKAMAAGRGVGPKLQDLRSKQLADGVPL